MDGLLRCPICYDFMRASVMIPDCSHTFCSFCIRKHLSHVNKCPVCNANAYETDLKNNRLVDDVIKQFTTIRSQLLEDLRKTEVCEIISSADLSSSSNSSFKSSTTRCQDSDNSNASNLLIERSSPANHQTRLQTIKNSKKNQTEAFDNSHAKHLTTSDLEELITISDSEEDKLPLNLSDKENIPDHSSSDLIVENTEIDQGSKSLQRKSGEEMTKELKTGNQENNEFQTPKAKSKYHDFLISPENNGSAKHLGDASLTPSPRNLVPCPVCGINLRESFINNHLDFCLGGESKKSVLRKATPKRKPMAKLVYNIMSDKDLRKKLKELGLSTVGDKKALIRRHHDYVMLYNSECDASNPRSVTEIIKEVEKNEFMRTKHQRPVHRLNIVKNSSAESIEKAQKDYMKNHKSHFSKLIEETRERMKKLKEVRKKEVEENKNEGKKEKKQDSTTEQRKQEGCKNNKLADCRDKQNAATYSHSDREVLRRRSARIQKAAVQTLSDGDEQILTASSSLCESDEKTTSGSLCESDEKTASGSLCEGGKKNILSESVKDPRSRSLSVEKELTEELNFKCNKNIHSRINQSLLTDSKHQENMNIFSKHEDSAISLCLLEKEPEDLNIVSLISDDEDNKIIESVLQEDSSESVVLEKKVDLGLNKGVESVIDSDSHGKRSFMGTHLPDQAQKTEEHVNDKFLGRSLAIPQLYCDDAHNNHDNSTEDLGEDEAIIAIKEGGSKTNLKLLKKYLAHSPENKSDLHKICDSADSQPCLVIEMNEGQNVQNDTCTRSSSTTHVSMNESTHEESLDTEKESKSKSPSFKEKIDLTTEMPNSDGEMDETEEFSSIWPALYQKPEPLPKMTHPSEGRVRHVSSVSEAASDLSNCSELSVILSPIKEPMVVNMERSLRSRIKRKSEEEIQGQKRKRSVEPLERKRQRR